MIKIKKAYGKFKKGLDKSAIGIAATTVGKDYGLGDSIFNKGGKKEKKGVKSKPVKVLGQVKVEFESKISDAERKEKEAGSPANVNIGDVRRRP